MIQDQLDRKEYLLQQSELKVYHYEKYLQRKGLLDHEARLLLNKFQMEENEQIQDRRVSNVVSDNLALKDQLKDTIRDVNRLDKVNSKHLKTISELKAKIEKMKKRHITSLKLASDSPAITASDQKIK